MTSKQVSHRRKLYLYNRLLCFVCFLITKNWKIFMPSPITNIFQNFATTFRLLAHQKTN